MPMLLHFSAVPNEGDAATSAHRSHPYRRAIVIAAPV